MAISQAWSSWPQLQLKRQTLSGPCVKALEAIGRLSSQQISLRLMCVLISTLVVPWALL